MVDLMECLREIYFSLRGAGDYQFFYGPNTVCCVFGSLS